MQSKSILLTVAIITASFFILRSEYAFHAYRNVKTWCVGKAHPAAYQCKVSSIKLNDVTADYSKKSRALGIKPQKNDQTLDSLADAGELTRVEGGEHYLLDNLTHSYPYLTPNAAQLLETIGSRFSDALKNTDLKNTQLRVTSLLRTSHSNKKLRQGNSNVSEESAHLYGIAFDISYTRFTPSVRWFFRKIFVPVKSHAQTKFLKETLANVLLQLKKEGKCWVTYEKKQHCFHVVSRY